MPTSTPWGKSQQANRIARGITIYSTASHGGIKLSAGRNKLVPEYMRAQRDGYGNDCGWYEEDCAACIPILIFPEYFTIAQVREAENTLLNWYPEQWEKFTGKICYPGMSSVRDSDIFRLENYCNFVVYSATAEGDMVRVRCRRECDGVEKETVVPRAEYKARKTPFFVLGG